MLDRTGRAAHGAPYSLLAPLPSEVVLRPAGTDYRSYPVFSVPWLKGRSLIFVPAALGMQLLQSTMLTVLMNVQMGLLSALVGVPVWLCFVCAGPVLATLVRHRGWPLKWERPAVIAAVAIGVCLSMGSQWAATAYSNKMMAAELRELFGATYLARMAHSGTALSRVEFLANLIFGICVGGGLALRTYLFELKRWRAVQLEREMEALRQQKTEADLRVAVLQAQVEPHFLFNTLASVHSLIRQDPGRAEATIEALVDHLRATMPKLRAGVGQQYSTLAEQLEVCESYLRVMQVRMGARLTYLRDVPEGLLGHPFPPLMLISLVENAIKHGLEPNPAGGNISLSAAIEDRGLSAQLAVSVIDDGVGLKPGLGGGVGLANIRAQLAARFGGYGELVMRARTAGGVSATIRVPRVERVEGAA